jgi:hypothetical protein
LDIKILKNKFGRIFSAYFAITLGCILFNFIYEQFSYGEHSDFMRMMFCVPMFGGVLPFWIIYLTRAEFTLSRIGYNLWNSGVALLTSGCLIRGIIEISGRTTDYDKFYWLLGGLMAIGGLFAQIRCTHKINKFKI